LLGIHLYLPGIIFRLRSAISGTERTTKWRRELSRDPHYRKTTLSRANWAYWRTNWPPPSSSSSQPANQAQEQIVAFVQWNFTITASLSIHSGVWSSEHNNWKELLIRCANLRTIFSANNCFCSGHTCCSCWATATSWRQCCNRQSTRSTWPTEWKAKHVKQKQLGIEWLS
jgi:hypothetical protein